MSIYDTPLSRPEKRSGSAAVKRKVTTSGWEGSGRALASLFGGENDQAERRKAQTTNKNISTEQMPYALKGH